MRATENLRDVIKSKDADKHFSEAERKLLKEAVDRGTEAINAAASDEDEYATGSGDDETPEALKIDAKTLAQVSSSTQKWYERRQRRRAHRLAGYPEPEQDDDEGQQP